MTIHPRLNDRGQPVQIPNPHVPTAISAWESSSALATVVPDGLMPAHVNGIPIESWACVPATKEVWAELASKTLFNEPPFEPMGMEPAAGAVVVECDGRVWLVAPTKAFGGYKATFPKGKTEDFGLHATAIKETFEESGLQVELFAHLVDVSRSTSRTRYYLARRLGGNPSAMGWETQAVHLAPVARLKELLNNKNDLPIVKALQEALSHSSRK